MATLKTVEEWTGPNVVLFKIEFKASDDWGQVSEEGKEKVRAAIFEARAAIVDILTVGSQFLPSDFVPSS